MFSMDNMKIIKIKYISRNNCLKTYKIYKYKHKALGRLTGDLPGKRNVLSSANGGVDQLTTTLFIQCCSMSPKVTCAAYCNYFDWFADQILTYVSKLTSEGMLTDSASVSNFQPFTVTKWCHFKYFRML
jgi:hypothetical protein